MTTNYETLLVSEPSGGVQVVTLNRPDRGNGVVPELAHELLACLNAAADDRRIRALVLTGAGETFCAGADVVEFDRYLREELREREEPFNARVLHPVVSRIRSIRLPVIAAINGAAVAGGLDLALSCDIRLASDRAKLGETYIRVGLAPGTGGGWMLPRLVGPGVAAELAFTGDLVDADRAHELGLVNRIVDGDVVAEAVAMASRIARWPAKAIEATKDMLRVAWQTDFDESLRAAFWTVHTLQYSRDVAEGIRAALEGRSADYHPEEGS